MNDVLEFATLDVKSQATSSAMPDSGEREKSICFPSLPVVAGPTSTHMRDRVAFHRSLKERFIGIQLRKYKFATR